MLYYKKEIEELVDRYRKVHDSRYQGALVQVQELDEAREKGAAPEVKPLYAWDFDRELFDFLDAVLAADEAYWGARTEIEDDSIPCQYPRFGIAEHSAYLGGNVILQKDTSYMEPIIREWEDVDRLHTDENNIWLRRILDGMDYILEKGKGKIAPRLRGGTCPGDLANMIRGNDIFMDFYDDPEAVHRMLDKCTETETWFIRQQQMHYEDFYGGVMDGNGIWLPKGYFGHLSEDWSYMCSPQMYAEFGLPYTKRLLDQLEGAEIHIHGGGGHIIPYVCSLEKAKCIQIVQDPNQISPVVLYRQYEECLKDKLTILQIPWQEIEPNIDLFQGKRIIFQVSTHTFEEAERVVELVHKNFPICMAES